MVTKISIQEVIISNQVLIYYLQEAATGKRWKRSTRSGSSDKEIV